jgi:hypothetical protein
VIAVLVAAATPVDGQSTINSWPTRCRSDIRLKTRCASEVGGGGGVDVLGAPLVSGVVVAGREPDARCGAVDDVL